MRRFLGLGVLVLTGACATACGGTVEGEGDSSGGSGSGATQTYACPVCSNAKLSCTVNGSMDTLVRAATSKTGCAFDFDTSAFSIDCDTQTFCIEGIGCAKYAATGNTFTVNSTFGRVSCVPSKS
jgi:hypothetical protein